MDSLKGRQYSNSLPTVSIHRIADCSCSSFVKINFILGLFSFKKKRRNSGKAMCCNCFNLRPSMTYLELKRELCNRGDLKKESCRSHYYGTLTTLYTWKVYRTHSKCGETQQELLSASHSAP